MTRKRKILTISEDLSDLKENIFTIRPETIDQAMQIIVRQMEITGNRPRTISDYQKHVSKFQEVTGLIKLKDINAASIYHWLSSMNNVSNQTKLIRLKCLKAFLSRCLDNGWFETNFWKRVNVKVNSKIKEGTKEADVNRLLSVLDFRDFVQLRDATAVLLMYRTGIRLNTLSQLENRHIDFSTNLLKLDGAIMKNHDSLLLPFDDTLNRLLTVLLRQNDMIREEYGQNNQFVFITKNGDSVMSTPTNNCIPKNLKRYAQRYGIKNISPHDFRRGFAKSLYDKGVNVTIISRALGHSDIAVTSKYLHLDKEEIAESLRRNL